MNYEQDIMKSLGVPNGQAQAVKENKLAASFMEQLILGDPEKNKAKTEGKQADAEFTRALAQLTQQMAIESSQKKASSNNTAVFLIGGVAIVGILFAAVMFIRKKNNSAVAA